MNSKCRIAVLVVSLLLTLGGAASWGQLPAGNDVSDNGGNTGGGTYALTQNTTGYYDTAYGASALPVNTTGYYNTAMGAYALNDNTTGSYNTATGTAALLYNTTGAHNSANGSWALYQNNGNDNTAVGYQALFNNQGGLGNTAVGNQALYRNTFASYNTAVGDGALYNNTTGGNNLALGLDAGFYSTGSNNIYLANYGVAGESNTMRLGNTATNTGGANTKRTFIAGVFGVSVTGSQVLINSKGQLGVLASSARYKRDIQDMGQRTQGLLKLRPVTFRYKQDPEGALQYGLIAEEVAKVYPELVVRGENGEVESVQYHEIISMLLNEVQHQQKALSAQSQQIAELKAQNDSLKAAHAQEMAELKAAVERLERLEARTGMLATDYGKSF